MISKGEDLMRLGREIPEDDDVNTLLGAIFAQQEADANHYQKMQDNWWAETRAKLRIMHDGIAWALRNNQWGGTTAQYEQCLTRICNLEYPPLEILDWYKQQELEHGPFSDYTPHPKFLSCDDPRGWAK
jgi:hypothetical protein